MLMLLFTVIVLAHVVLAPLGIYLAGQLISNRVPVWMMALLVVVMVAGVGLAAANVARLQEAGRRQGWPETVGRVVEARVVGDVRVWVSTGLNEIDDEKFSEDTPQNVRGDRNLRPEITYTYTVDGQRFEKTTDLHLPGFGGTLNRLDVGLKSIAEYPPGREVSVTYNPEAPDVSYLRPGPTWDAYMQLALGTLLYGVALGALIASVRSQRQATGVPA